MAKSPKKPKPEDIEPEPGAWGRFEQAVDAAVKSGPKPRTSPKSKHKPVFSGTIAEKAVYDYALSPEEIYDLMLR